MHALGMFFYSNLSVHKLGLLDIHFSIAVVGDVCFTVLIVTDNCVSAR